AFILVCAVVALAHWAGPPDVGKPPNPSLINASPRPDWYFLWYFAVLAKLPKHVEQPWFIVLAPLVAAIVLIALPFVFPAGERRLTRRPWAVIVAAGLLFVVGYFWWLGERAPWSPCSTHRRSPYRARSAPTLFWSMVHGCSMTRD